MSEHANTPPGRGGKGGEYGSQQTSDTRLVERAIRQRWPIPEDRRPAIMDRLIQVATGEGVSDRNRVVAARALLAADALNMQQEKLDQGGDTLNVNVKGGVRVEPTPDYSRLTDGELLALYELMRKAKAGPEPPRVVEALPGPPLPQATVNTDNPS
jgi:hypothetical protein